MHTATVGLSRSCKTCCSSRRPAHLRPIRQAHVRESRPWGYFVAQARQLCQIRQCVRRRAPAMAATAQKSGASTALPVENGTLICTAVTAKTMQGFLDEIQEAAAAGVDVIELRLDFLTEFNPEVDLEVLMAACPIPYIVTYRPTWEGGNYAGPEPERLATLKLAALRGAPYVDVEFKAAPLFFAGHGEVPVNTKVIILCIHCPEVDTLRTTRYLYARMLAAGRGEVPESTKVIVSYHDFQKTPSSDTLRMLVDGMWNAGADIVKLVGFANDISDCAPMLQLLKDKKGPTIALSMGEKGQIVRLLAGHYGGYLTFGTTSSERASAPGQPSVALLKGLYNLQGQTADSRLFGIVGNPVHHSRSPLIHNNAFQHIGFDGVYVPLLVDDLQRFLDSFGRSDFHGFSVTIPHKEAALRLADSVDPVAAQIGAVNTLVRQPDGSFRGYNTDWSAAISAIEAKLGGAEPLKGATFVVVGAGGAARALAFGAASRGARVVLANRSRARAEELAASMAPGTVSVADWSELQAGALSGDVLANSTSVGMVPKVEETPVPSSSLSQFRLVFDAVYTPRETRLLQEAAAAGCMTVDGVAMFVGQAADQFRHFTDAEPPLDVMERVLLESMQKK